MLVYSDLTRVLIQSFPEFSAQITDRESGPYVSFGQFFKALKTDVESKIDPIPLILRAVRLFEDMCESNDLDVEELVAIDLIYDIADSPLLLDHVKKLAKGRLAERINGVGPNYSNNDPYGKGRS